MDNRKPHDTKVVRLRRNGDPDDQERQRLASTIFAEQDDVGTFSRGNLVPPVRTETTNGTEGQVADPVADPFFDQLQAPTVGRAEAAPVTDPRDATTAYFERLGAETPAQMTESLAPQASAAAMPGSARLPRDLESQQQHRWSRPRPDGPSGRLLAIPRFRVAAPPLLAALGGLIVAGAALAAIVGGGGNHASSAKQLPANPLTAPSSHNASASASARLGPLGLNPSIRRPSSTRHPALREHRHRTPMKHVISAAHHRAPPAASTSSVTAAPVDRTPAQTVQPSPAAQQPVSQASVPETTSGSASTAGSGSTSRPAFGANGTLGPGHSPNG